MKTSYKMVVSGIPVKEEVFGGGGRTSTTTFSHPITTAISRKKNEWL